MRATIRAMFLLVVLPATAGMLQAGEKFDPESRAKAIAPFIDQTTVAVAHVDLSRFDVRPFVDFAVALIYPSGNWERISGAVNGVLEGARDAGCDELYAVVTLARPDDPFFLVVPIPEGADEETLKATLEKWSSLGFKRVHGALFLGWTDWLETYGPDPRPDLARAFAAAGDTAGQLVVVPPAHTARVLQEILPTLPDEVGGGPITVLTRGVRWAAAGADGPPKTSFRLTIQSEDDQAAAALRKKWIELFPRVTSLELIRHSVPKALEPYVTEAAGLFTPRVEGDRLVLALTQEQMAALMPVITHVRDATVGPAHSCSHLRRIGGAMYDYRRKHGGRLPPAAGYGADGKPTLSWRVQILPFLGEAEQKLYEEFHLDEPWDSPHNRKLIPRMPDVYRSPGSKLEEKGITSYLVVVGDETVFPGREGLSTGEIKDGLSRTLLVVEVPDGRAVPWTKPEDLPFEPEQLAKTLGGPFEGGFHALFANGINVRFLRVPIDPETLRALSTRAGGESVDVSGL
jgi:hypothetical protein